INKKSVAAGVITSVNAECDKVDFMWPAARDIFVKVQRTVGASIAEAPYQCIVIAGVICKDQPGGKTCFCQARVECGGWGAEDLNGDAPVSLCRVESIYSYSVNGGCAENDANCFTAHRRFLKFPTF